MGYLTAMLEKVADAVIAAEPQLTELDSAIGDGDCGTGMKAGFLALKNKLGDMKDASASDVLKMAGLTMISVVEGTSGAIYGSFFIKMAGAAKDVSRIDKNAVCDMLRAGLEGAKARGEDTQVGDKTLIDALEPAINAFCEAVQNGEDYAAACHEASEAAQKGSDSTIDMVARKGRASYLGERSRGHRDAGSYAIVVMCRAAEKYVSNKKVN